MTKRERSNANTQLEKESLFTLIKNFVKPKYSVMDVFGCSERIPPRCPTFLDRKVHERFANAIEANNIIVVYGESRQGKTWAIEKFCKKQIRINCVTDMTLDSIKRTMLAELGYSTMPFEHKQHSSRQDTLEVHSKIASPISSVGGKIAHQDLTEEQTTATYSEVDVDEQNTFIRAILDKIANRYYVFDNFHYLSTQAQQSFCSLLRDFNYHGIKIIIIGVWKEASRITSLAPDLINRCAHIDIGTWEDKELASVAELGQSALNIKINSNILKQFTKYSVHNIGIFKDILLRFCQLNSVKRTLNRTTCFSNSEATDLALRHVFEEAYRPLRDRLINLSTPKREKQDSKHMRKKIVCAVLQIIASSRNNVISQGIELSSIIFEISKICSLNGEPNIPNSNITQELGVLHLREENKGVQENYIPLFYFDTANRKLFVLEPTLYFVKAYSINMFKKIIDDINIDSL